MDGIALAQPALALAAKMLARAEQAGVPVPLPSTVDEWGAVLFRVVADARAAGVDAEAALRRAALAYADAVREAERAR
jgi:XTP/dITP diphosphohydrolase